MVTSVSTQVDAKDSEKAEAQKRIDEALYVEREDAAIIAIYVRQIIENKLTLESLRAKSALTQPDLEAVRLEVERLRSSSPAPSPAPSSDLRSTSSASFTPPSSSTPPIAVSASPALAEVSDASSSAGVSQANADASPKAATNVDFFGGADSKYGDPTRQSRSGSVAPLAPRTKTTILESQRLASLKPIIPEALSQWPDNSAKNVSTSIAKMFFGTVLFLGGLIAAPFTFGASLVVSIAGAALFVNGVNKKETKLVVPVAVRPNQSVEGSKTYDLSESTTQAYITEKLSKLAAEQESKLAAEQKSAENSRSRANSDVTGEVSNDMTEDSSDTQQRRDDRFKGFPLTPKPKAVRRDRSNSDPVVPSTSPVLRK